MSRPPVATACPVTGSRPANPRQRPAGFGPQPGHADGRHQVSAQLRGLRLPAAPGSFPLVAGRDHADSSGHAAGQAGRSHKTLFDRSSCVTPLLPPGAQVRAAAAAGHAPQHLRV